MATTTAIRDKCYSNKMCTDGFDCSKLRCLQQCAWEPPCIHVAAAAVILDDSDAVDVDDVFVAAVGAVAVAAVHCCVAIAVVVVVAAIAVAALTLLLAGAAAVRRNDFV